MQPGLAAVEACGVRVVSGNLIGLPVALLTTAVSFSIYVIGVRNRDRALSRWAALTFFVSGAVAVLSLVRIL